MIQASVVKYEGCHGTCAKCGKPINGKCAVHVPPLLHIQLGVDYVTAYHPECIPDEDRECDDD